MKPTKSGFYWGKFYNKWNKEMPYHLIIEVQGEPPWLNVKSIVDFGKTTMYKNADLINSILYTIEWGPEIEKPV